jgi:O-antigen/teichoic acid export membrane protein
LLLVGAIVLSGGSYLYNVICIRWLGGEAFGDVAALTTLSTLVFLPLTGVQGAVAREAARLGAEGDDTKVAAFARAVARRTLFLAAGLVCGVAALTPVIEHTLHVTSGASVLLTAALIGVGTLLTVLQGVLQGVGMFRRMALGLVVYGLARPILVPPLQLLGASVAGAMAASALGVAVAAAVSLGPVAALARRTHSTKAPPVQGFRLVLIGLLAMTALTNLDVLVAKAGLSSHAAGVYASAALVGKLALLIPSAAVGAILLPRATARVSRGQDATPIVLRSMAVTVGFGLGLTLALALLPRSAVVFSFGPDFAGARDLLAPSAAAMTLYGALSVHLSMALATHDRSLVSMLVAAVPFELALFILLHASGYEIIVAMAIAAAIPLAIHEARSPHSTWRMARGQST